MKKSIIILLLALCSFVLQAQDVNFPLTFQPSQTFVYYAPTATQTLSSTVDSIASSIYLNKGYPAYYDVAVKLDTIHSGATASGRITVKLQGRLTDKAIWSDITSVSYYGTADTTIAYSQHATPVWYNQFRVLTKRTAGSSKFEYVYFKVWANK